MNEHIRLASDADAPPEAVSFVEAACERASLGPELSGRIVLAAAEAAANAAEHGNELNTERFVVIGCRYDEEGFTVWVQDEGAGLTAEQIEEAALPEDPMDTGGRGLFLIRELADRVALSAGGRRIEMWWRIA